MLKLKIHRKKSYVYSVYKVKVFADKACLGELKNGKTTEFEITNEISAIQVKGGPYKSPLIELDDQDYHEYTLEPTQHISLPKLLIISVLFSGVARYFENIDWKISGGIVLTVLVLETLVFRQKWRLTKINDVVQ